MLLDTTEMKLNIVQIQKKLENQGKNVEWVFSYLDELIEKKEDPSLQGELAKQKPRTKIGYKK
jgi:hypothetical protein